MSGHTPGPWVVSDGNSIVATWSDLGEEVQVAGIHTTHWSLPDGGRNQRISRESEANACLIAAAPELLAACKQALWNLNGPNKDLDVLRAVIAKAEGK